MVKQLYMNIYRFESCQTKIIKINYLKFKKTPGTINFVKQIELKFIAQKRMLSTDLILY